MNTLYLFSFASNSLNAICLGKLDIETKSKSITVILPIPLPAKYNPVGHPNPPAPIIKIF